MDTQITTTWDSFKQQFAGVSTPEEMGTTGLCAWVIAGPGGYYRDWQRLQKACGIIRRRHGKGAVVRFCAAIWATLDRNKWARNRMARQLRSFGYMAEAA